MNAPYHNKALPQGTILREWRLEDVLGAGGFGIVYRGKGIYFGETVAIKEYFPGAISDRLDGTTVAPTDSSSEEVYELGRPKFLEEAKVLWNLSRPERHPNIVSVRSLFEIHGTAYMVMDFESGVSLSEMLKDGRKFDEQSLLALIKPITDGLERAHGAGVLHRDIKPANILVNQSGRPVLIDFGSARFESGQATNTKVTFYTPPYAAIEQYVKSYPQGGWTDIYALGVVLYQCVTGEKPPEVLERLHGGYGQALSARQWPGFGRVFTRAVDAAMAIRPLERPQTISDWMKLFDLKDSPQEDEPTRIGTPLSDGQLLAVASAALPAAEASKSPAVRPERQALAPRARKFSPVVLKSLAAAALIGVAVAAFWGLRRHDTSPPAPPVSSAAGPMAVSANVNPGLELAGKMDELILTATKVGRRGSEISNLTDRKAKIVALAAGIKAGASQPGDNGANSAAQAQLNAAGADVFRDEASILGRVVNRLWTEVDRPIDTQDSADGAKAVAQLQQAKTSLDASLATDPKSLNAIQAIDTTQKALLDFGAFQNSYNKAVPFYAAARSAEFNALSSTAQTISGQVVTLAAVSKPWVLASQARKQSYQLRQDYAAQAKSLAAQLSTLSASVSATSDIKQLNQAVAQATTIKNALDTLFTTSNNLNL